MSTLVTITSSALIGLGFKVLDYGDDPPYTSFKKHGIEVWQFNEGHWIVDMLDQNGIEKEFYFMDELNEFFTACGLKMSNDDHPTHPH